MIGSVSKAATLTPMSRTSKVNPGSARPASTLSRRGFASRPVRKMSGAHPCRLTDAAEAGVMRVGAGDHRGKRCQGIAVGKPRRGNGSGHRRKCPIDDAALGQHRA